MHEQGECKQGTVTQDTQSHTEGMARSWQCTQNPLSLCLTRCSRGVVLSRTVQQRKQGSCAPPHSQGLVPMAEKIVATVYLASATLRSVRHSCSGRPPCLPAALVTARLYPASLRRSVSTPAPNRPLSSEEMLVTLTPPFAHPNLLVFVRSACAAAGASSCPVRMTEE